ncbi:response regulator [Georgenia sp. Z1344]|uniref:response regulator n=1 Tax=Georgenia sp. Z1344 TaxID=3416706 RepID=UPI003CE8B8A4
MIRVLVVDDDALVRSGLSMILASVDDLEVVAEAADGRAGVEAAIAHRPDVVLMDVRMPVLDGITATAEITRAVPTARVCVLTTFQLDEYVFGALRSGAAGFLLKDAGPRQIVDAVRSVAAGEAILSPAATRTLIDAYAPMDDTAEVAAARRLLDELTPREREVADAVARGESNAEIAAALHMSETTVKSHVTRIFGKLGVDNRVKVAIHVRVAGGRS